MTNKMTGSLFSYRGGKRFSHCVPDTNVDRPAIHSEKLSFWSQIRSREDSLAYLLPVGEGRGGEGRGGGYIQQLAMTPHVTHFHSQR